MIRYDIFITSNWVVTRWHYTFTHKQFKNNTNNTRTTQIQINVEEYGPCPIFASFTLSFALQLRKKHGKASVRARKTSVRLRKTSVRVQYIIKTTTHYKTLTNTHITKPTHTHTHTHTHIAKQYKTTTVQIKTKCIYPRGTNYKYIYVVRRDAVYSGR
jgi:hypothetical protein